MRTVIKIMLLSAIWATSIAQAPFEKGHLYFQGGVGKIVYLDNINTNGMLKNFVSGTVEYALFKKIGVQGGIRYSPKGTHTYVFKQTQNSLFAVKYYFQPKGYRINVALGPSMRVFWKYHIYDNGNLKYSMPTFTYYGVYTSASYFYKRKLGLTLNAEIYPNQNIDVLAKHFRIEKFSTSNLLLLSAGLILKL